MSPFQKTALTLRRAHTSRDEEKRPRATVGQMALAPVTVRPRWWCRDSAGPTAAAAAAAASQPAPTERTEQRAAAAAALPSFVCPVPSWTRRANTTDRYRRSLRRSHDHNTAGPFFRARAACVCVCACVCARVCVNIFPRVQRVCSGECVLRPTVFDDACVRFLRVFACLSFSATI